jgi:hypothetical protein
VLAEVIVDVVADKVELCHHLRELFDGNPRAFAGIFCNALLEHAFVDSAYHAKGLLQLLKLLVLVLDLVFLSVDAGLPLVSDFLEVLGLVVDPLEI